MSDEVTSGGDARESRGCPVDHVLLTARRDPESIYCPAAELAAFRDSGAYPVVSGSVPQYGEFSGVGITRYDEVRNALNDPSARMGPDPAKAPSSLIAQPGFFQFIDGEDHSSLRRMLAPHFSVKRVARYAERITLLVENVLDRMEQQDGEADLVRDFARPIPKQVICEILGIPYADRDVFGEWTEVITDRGAEPADAIAAIGSLREYMFEHVSRQRRDPDDSLVGGLIADQGAVLDDETLVGISMMVLLAGHETTTNGIAFGAVALLERPEQLELVREDPTVLPGAAEELVRFLSLAQPHYRRMADATTVGNHEFEPDESFVVSLLAANFDPTLVGENPDLRIDRDPVAHVGFGYGPHQCVGQHLARLELRIALPALFKRFPTLALVRPANELLLREIASIRGIVEVPVTW